MSTDARREVPTRSDVDPAPAPLLAVRGATKRFGGVPALVDANLTVAAGQVMALIGENGAGKSTLVKALAGVHRLDEGSMRLAGEPYHPDGPRDAHDVGLSVIYQEPSLFPDLSIAENIFVGQQPTVRGRVDWSSMRSRAAELFVQLEVPLAPDAPAKGLSIADQQLVEIAKALAVDARLLVMDEPTAALSSSEVERLMAVVRRLRDRGAGIVFITHKLDEVFGLCDRITVMRDGATVSEADVADVTVGDIIQDMVGRELVELYPKAEATVGEPLLEVEGLTSAGHFRDVSLTVRSGEIVGLAGLVGAGRSEVLSAIFGLLPIDGGVVRLDGEQITPDPVRCVERGVALVPEDRRLQGLFMPTSVVGNTAITSLGRLRRGLLLSRRRERRTAMEWADNLEVRYASIDQPVESLSGGNQQKVVLAKWLATDPKLLLIDEPTRGIDVGTKAEVHRRIGEAVERGLGVLMVSSDLPEVLALADRVYVMREGHLVTEMPRQEVTQERVMVAATGADA